MATKSTKSTKPALAAVQNTPKPSPESTTASAPKVAVVPKVDAEATDSAPKAETVKMKDLLTTVTTKTGAKKKDAKDVIDALLAEVGQLRRQMPEGGPSGERNLRDELPPHY